MPTLSTTNSTWTKQGANLGLRGISDTKIEEVNVMILESRKQTEESEEDVIKDIQQKWSVVQAVPKGCN